MIRILYWLMVFVETVILLLTIFLFLLTDSDTIRVATKDLLAQYHIYYEKISGNLIRGIEIDRLSYDGNEFIRHATVHWNPFALLENKINITQLDIEGANPMVILNMVETLSSGASSTKTKLDMDITVNQMNLHANPFTYYGVNFDAFRLGTEEVEVDCNLSVNSDFFTLSVASDLVNVDVRGEVAKNRLKLDQARLLEIDPKAITAIVHAINHASKGEIKTTPPPQKGGDTTAFPLGLITVDTLTATMKTTTYGPITIDKTLILANKVRVEPNRHFNYSAKEVTLSTDTSFASTKQTGYIKDSMVYAKGDLITKPHLFERYHLPLNQKGLKRLPSKLKVNHEGVWVEINDKVDKVLVLNGSDFNVDLKQVKHKMDYRYTDSFIKITSEGKGAMNYSDEVDVQNMVDIDFRGDETYTNYYGVVKLHTISHLPETFATTLLKNFTAAYKGDPDALEVNFVSNALVGSFQTKGYEKATLNVEGKEPIPLKNLLKNPRKEWVDATGRVKGNAQLDLVHSENSTIHLTLDSPLANLQADMRLKKPYRIAFEGALPKDTWVERLDRRLKLEQFGKFDGAMVLYPNSYGITFQGGGIALEGEYTEQRGGTAKGVVEVAGETLYFEGAVNQSWQLSTSLGTIAPLEKIFHRYYDLPLAPMKGSADVTLRATPDGNIAISMTSSDVTYGDLQGDIVAHVDIDASNTVHISGKSKELTYDDGNGTKQKLYKLSTDLLWDDGEITLNRYSVRIRNNDYISRIYAKQPSYLHYTDDRLCIKELWINDQIMVMGFYNIATGAVALQLHANRFDYKNKDFEFISQLNLKIRSEQQKESMGYAITGGIKLLEAKSSYELLGSGMSQDSDIIIVQEERVKEKSALNKLRLAIRIENDNPISYASKDINIKMRNMINVIKAYKQADVGITGETNILEGYYQQEDKRFNLAGSNVYFYGDPSKPLLEIRATYQKEQYTIQIFITGSTDDPIINFNSDPYLSQKEILSLILFDTTTSTSGTGSNTELYAMLGGTFAKELMKSLGINVDHLLLGEGIDESLSVEVGRKISNNITVIYLHENGRDGVKLRVDHSKKFETDIILQPPKSSSIEFLYKSD